MALDAVGLRLFCSSFGTETMAETSAVRWKIIALIPSGIFPGLGQFYSRQPIKGAAFIAAGVVLSWLLGRVVPTDLLALTRPGVSLAANVIVPLGVLLALWLWAVIDAWRVAGR